MGGQGPLLDAVSTTMPTMSITVGIVWVLLRLARTGNLNLNPIIEALAEWIRLPVDLIKAASQRRDKRLRLKHHIDPASDQPLPFTEGSMTSRRTP